MYPKLASAAAAGSSCTLPGLIVANERASIGGSGRSREVCWYLHHPQSDTVNAHLAGLPLSAVQQYDRDMDSRSVGDDSGWFLVTTQPCSIQEHGSREGTSREERLSAVHLSWDV